MRATMGFSIVVICLAVSGAAAIQSEGGFTDLGAGDVWLASVPQNLNVYVFPENEFPHRSFAGGEVLPSMSEQSLSGHTPLRLELEPGSYMVIFESREVVAGQLITDGSTQYGAVYRKNEAGEFAPFNQWRLYRLEVPSDAPAVLIALFQPEDTTLADIEPLFPPQETYPFGAAAVQNLKDRETLAAHDLDLAGELIRRGGRLALKSSGGGMLVVVVTPDGFNVDHYQ